MSLPSAPTRNALSVPALRALIAGKPGSGKTTFASGWFPQSNLHIDLEGGTRFLTGDHFVVRPKTYTEFHGIIDDLVRGDHPFECVTVDTIDALVRIADGEAGQRHGRIAAALAEFGKGLADRDATIQRDFERLFGSDLGVILLSHAERVEDPENKNAPARWQPSVEKRLRPYFMGAVDFLWFSEVTGASGDQRVLYAQPNHRFECKSRVPMPDTLPLDPASVYQALAAGIQSLTTTKEQ